MPWLSCCAVVFAVLWFLSLRFWKSLFARPIARFKGLSLRKEIALVGVILGVALTVVPKSDRGMGGNGESRIENGESGGGPRSLPPALASASNLIAILSFVPDPPNRSAAFEVACSNILFDYTASRDLYLFASTNLLEPRWMPICAFAMPADTNICAFAVTTNDVDAAALPLFLDSMDGIGFYRFAADIDTDGDGLIDSYETLCSFTDPELADTDDDGLDDGYEISAGTDPLVFDTDDDGLSDGDEDSLGTDPLVSDTDGDGLPDGDETLTHGTDPFLFDTDGDGLSDYAEISAVHTDPVLADTDGDGLLDGDEILLYTDPLLADTDGDGMPDGWEVWNSLNPAVDDAAGDADGDGVANIDEWRAGSDPNSADTDDDGLPDAVECAVAAVSADAVPWFDMAGATVMSPATDADSGLFACDLPFTNTVAAVPLAVAVADVNGMVYFGGASSTNGLCSRDECQSMSEGLGFPGVAVAPYWSDLRLRASLGSSISHKLASHSGTNYFVIQYGRVGTQGWSDNSEFSFQVSVPETFPSNTVYVRYGTLVDGRDYACMVSIGAQSPGGFAKVPLSFAAPVHAPVGYGATVAYRFGCGTDPLNADTDGDGLPDGAETLSHGTDPLLADTDGDGLPDGWEILHGLDPLSASGGDGSSGDPDDDGLSNAAELAAGTDPAVPDTDLDGLSDGAEALTHGSDPLSPDTDGDGLDDGEEAYLGTSPLLSDTDGDGLPDGWEIQYGLDPLSASGGDGADGDPDGDGVENARELALGTDPLDGDTDLDGLSDGEEAGRRSASVAAPWLDMQALGPSCPGWRVFDADNPPDGVRMAIPNPISASGVTYTHFSVDTCGVVHLYTNGLDMAAATLPCRDLEQEAGCPSSFTAAALWAPLEFGTQSVVSVCQYGRHLLVVEYSRMCLEGTSGSPGDEATVQVVAGPDIDGSLLLEFVYGDVGSNVCNAASVGFSGIGGRMRQTYSFLGTQPLAHRTVDFWTETGLGTDPALADTDDDGLFDGAEVLTHGTDPFLADTDGDGLSDYAEISAVHTDPVLADTDGDGLLDGWEVANQLNPLSSSGDDGAGGDIDNDGLTNIQEQALGGNPRSADTDGDDLSDALEVQNGTDLSLADTDRDGLTDGQEVTLGLNPLQPDSDGDGMNDGWEYQHRNAGFDPAVDNAADLNQDNDADADPDGDGASNQQESDAGTDPDNPDSDGDGIGDGTEIGQGTNPNDRADTIPVRWVSVTGDLGEGKTKLVRESVTIPAGTSAFVGVFIHSEEYPYYTGQASRFDDQVFWWVEAGGRAHLHGVANVNNEDGAWDAADANGQSAHGFGPVVLKDATFCTAPGDADLSVHVDISAKNVSDGSFPSTVLVGFFPVKVVQANMPAGVGVAGTTDGGTSYVRAFIPTNGIAYITAQPAAPQLTAQVKDLPEWLRVKWNMTLVSERPERFDGIDDRTLPQVELSGSAPYYITVELNNEIVGGRCNLGIQVAGGPSITYPFFIRGKNPLDATARAYITAQVPANTAAYAWKISKHESKTGNATRFYNQFNPSQDTYKELPFKGNGASNWGWGLAQIDRGRNNPNTGEIYDWHQNVDAMRVKLQEASDNTTRFIGYYSSSYSSFPNWTEPPATNINGQVVSAEMWSILTLYNGSGGIPEQRTPTSPRAFHSPVQFIPATGEWKFHTNSSNPDYVRDVLTDSELQEIE